MDIPTTGAIFTLGKAQLAENTQSYFYIKNDAIKRVIAGPLQSAVICESGRLFVWGENPYGQLGIGTHNSAQRNNNNNKADIIVKPTCVKSLKSLGLKVADLAFGNNWSIILTQSNELFYTGRNIFTDDSSDDAGGITKHFTEATVNEETCKIVRKPFRLEEFDDCLSNSEEAENYTNILAGNEHFMVLTSFGRLIGWGSNGSHQLGLPKREPVLKPCEITLDSPVQQFTCGPESTLVLTEQGNLFLTGHLNDFVFPQFTELQKNLSAHEQITFMHISRASDIFIITNAGNIYRSFESLRNKSLIFQRFYDYDSEEYGSIWKLLKGTSFYAVLTNSQKFYTTFSESGHHLKTFREITKFRNLRIMDVALGDQHILVQGLPRTAANTLPPTANRSMRRDHFSSSPTRAGYANIVKSPPIDAENNQLNGQISRTPKTNVPVQLTSEDNTQEIEDNSASPAESLRSRKSVSSIKTVKKIQSNEKQLRSRTPYPDSTASSSSPASVIRRTPLRNSSYEAAMSDDLIEQTSPAFLESLDAIPETAVLETMHITPGVKVATPTPPTEDDEQLTVEIHESRDPLDNSKVINEIRFINDGIDVTANVEKQGRYSVHTAEGKMEVDVEQEQEKLHNIFARDEEIRKEAEMLVNDLEDEIEKRSIREGEEINTCTAIKKDEEVVQENIESNIARSPTTIRDKTDDVSKSVERRLSAIKESVETAAPRVASGSQSVHNVNENIKKVARTTLQGIGDTTDTVADTLQQAGSDVVKETNDGKDGLGGTLQKIADDTRSAVGSVASKLTNEMRDVKNSFQSLLGGKHNKVDVEQVPKLDNADNAHEVVNSSTQPVNTNKVDVEQVPKLDNAENAHEVVNSSTQPVNTTNITSYAKDDDERTTASVNSTHTPGRGGNPPESNSTNPFENDTDDLNDEINKHNLRKQLSTMSVPVEQHRLDDMIEEMDKEPSKFERFWRGMKEKSRNLSCGNDKSIRIVDDQPPRYTVHDEFALQPIDEHNTQGSKVCTVL